MIYTSTQGEETRFFPDYFRLPNSRRLHPVPSTGGSPPRRLPQHLLRLGPGQADLIGAVVAGWGDVGLHPETFWLGYATITAAAWHPGSPSVEESGARSTGCFTGRERREWIACIS